jgi:hypothetical protein
VQLGGSREHVRWLTRPVRDCMGIDCVAAIFAAGMLKEKKTWAGGRRRTQSGRELNTQTARAGVRLDRGRAQAVKGSRGAARAGSLAQLGGCEGQRGGRQRQTGSGW